MGLYFQILITMLLFWPIFGAKNGYATTEMTQKYRQLATELEKCQPPVILIGNSILGTAVEEQTLAERTGYPVKKIWLPGASAAWWYLALKYIVADLSYTPKVVAFVYRDNEFSRPKFRTTGKYESRFSVFVENDDEFHKKVYDTELTPYRHLYRQYRKFQAAQKQTIENFLKKVSAKIRNLPLETIDTVINKYFSDSNMNAYLLTKAQIQAEKNTNNSLNKFSDRLDKTFLPTMIKIAQEKKINLLFINMKKREQATGVNLSATSSKYLNDFEAYLKTNDIPLLNYSTHQALLLGHYAAGDHFNKFGRSVFSDLLSKDFVDLFGSGLGSDQNLCK